MLEARAILVWSLVLAGAGLGGCKQAEPTPPASAESIAPPPSPDRRARCEQLARDAAEGAAVGVKLLFATLGEPASSDLVERCMAWPDETIACFSNPLAAFGDDCERLLAEATGQAVAPRDVSLGPPTAWRASLAGKVRALHVTADGTVIVQVDDATDPSAGEVLELDGGDERWRWRIDPGVRLLSAADGSALVTRGPTLGLLQLATGQPRWFPPLPSDAEPGAGTSSIRGVATTASGWLVLDDHARSFSATANTCMRRGSSCWTAKGHLRDETIDEVDMLVHDERLWLRTRTTLRTFTLQGLEPLFVARAHDTIGWLAEHPRGLVTVIDDDVLLLDPSACHSTSPERTVALSSWPRPGRAHAPSLDGCPDCAEPPPGCVVWRVYVPGVDTVAAPSIAEDGTIVVHDTHGFTVALRDGEPVWKSATFGVGPILADGHDWLVLSTGFAEGDPLAMRSLAGDDGRHLFVTPLPLSADAVVVASDDFHFARGADLAAAAYRTELVTVDLSLRE